jgi:primase-polymerase (primpol)-like protein
MEKINKKVKKPKSFFNPNPNAYASEMKEHNQWLFSRLKERADGTWSKPPCNASGYYNDGTDENNWLSFEKAFSICEASPYKFFGIGFYISSACPIKGIDMDHIYDPEKGWNQQALQELRSLNTRVEWSPSHTGVHVFFNCPITLKSANKTQPDGTGREMYFEKHYLTVTGQVVEGFPASINEVDPKLLIQLYEK